VGGFPPQAAPFTNLIVKSPSGPCRIQ
jgi:hypothetical protein